MTKFNLLLSTSLLVFAAAATPASAQDAPAPAETAPTEAQDASAPTSPRQAAPAAAASQAPVDGSALQDIIVTAERRFNTAQKTAAAITVRPGAEMLR
ncbi:MAG: hypothetical protein ABWY35_11015, partial [Pseudorhodoplanes sp.]